MTGHGGDVFDSDIYISPHGTSRIPLPPLCVPLLEVMGHAQRAAG